jgi:hypothetical protein
MVLVVDTTATHTVGPIASRRRYEKHQRVAERLMPTLREVS